MKIKKALVVASTCLLCFPSLFSPVIATSIPESDLENSVELPKEPELLDPLESTTETKAPIFSFEENQVPHMAGKQLFLVVHVSQEVSEFVVDLSKGVSIVEDKQFADIKFTNIEVNQWQVKANSPQVTFSIPLMVEEAGEYEVAIGESKTMLNIQIEDNQQTTEPETISSQEKEIEKTEKLNGEDEANTNQEIEDERINASRNGTWGTVSWSWVSSTRTITLQGGTAGTATSAPWKTHTDVARIIVEGRVTLPKDSSQLFMSLQNLESINNIERIDTSNVTIMMGMFRSTKSLKAIDLSNWDTSKVIDMGFIFANSSSLENLNVSNWDTSNVINMMGMFQSTRSLKAIDLSNWDTSNVIVADNMFFDMTNLSELRLGTKSRFDHLTSRAIMFPDITSSDNYTGSWVYYLNQANTIPEAYITSSSANFWREYDGSNPGTYQWQKKGSVAVHYRDINDQEVIAPEIIIGGVREPFQIEEKAIEGYTLQEIPDNTSGRFTEEEQVVIFRYMKDPVDPVDPLNPEIEVDPENKPDLPEDQGLLSIDFVSSFHFGSQVISVQDQNYYAQPQRLLNGDGTVNEEEERPNYVQISDLRSESDRNGWQFSVTQNSQFSTENGKELSGARMRLTNQQLATAHGGTAPFLQQTKPLELVPGAKRVLLMAQGNEGTGTWIYRFGDANTAGNSVVLDVPKGANPEATSYSSTFTWELSAVPKN